MEHANLYLHLAIGFAFFMAWGVGANDVANAMGTSVGSKAIKFWQAIIIAAVFEAAGSMLAGGQVTQTIRSQIIDPSEVSHHSLILGMLAALLSAGTWLIIASYRGWPVSTTHTIIGAIVGFGLVELGPRHIEWYQMTHIFLSWVLTPIISGCIAFLLFRSVQFLIFNAPNPIKNAKRGLQFTIKLLAPALTVVWPVFKKKLYKNIPKNPDKKKRK